MKTPTKPLIGVIAAAGLLISSGSALAFQSGAPTEPLTSGSPVGACVEHYEDGYPPPAGDPILEVENPGATVILPASAECLGGEGIEPGPPKGVIPGGPELPGGPKGKF